MSEDRRRALAGYDQMADLYADDAAVDPIKVSYDRPTILAMAGDVRGKRVLDVGCSGGRRPGRDARRPRRAGEVAELVDDQELQRAGLRGN